jgi:hypothetical protein
MTDCVSTRANAMWVQRVSSIFSKKKVSFSKKRNAVIHYFLHKLPEEFLVK